MILNSKSFIILLPQISQIWRVFGKFGFIRIGSLFNGFIMISTFLPEYVHSGSLSLGQVNSQAQMGSTSTYLFLSYTRFIATDCN